MDLGKSSQLKLLKEKLEKENYKVYSCNFIHSDFIKPSLLKTKWENANKYTFACMYAMGLSQTYYENIVDKINDGYIVLLDRYIYTIFLKAVVAGIEKEWAMNLISFFKVPDLTFWIDVPESICLDRKTALGQKLSYWECGCNIFGNDECRFEYNENKMKDLFLIYQKKCREILAEQCKNNGWIRINGTETMETISTTIYNKTIDFINK